MLVVLLYTKIIFHVLYSVDFKYQHIYLPYPKTPTARMPSPLYARLEPNTLPIGKSGVMACSWDHTPTT